MAPQIRRVVTGHDANGNSIVEIDEVATNIVSRRSGHASAVIWTTSQAPCDNTETGDQGSRDVARCAREGAIFRVVEYGPGVSPRMHRTLTIDYAVVMSGEIFMALDGGKEVHLKAGDVLVQRGAAHDWINRGQVPCVIAFVLMAAKPVKAGGRTLDALG